METQRVGHAITLGEWRAAHVRVTGEHLGSLDAIAARLRQRGFVQAVAGRTRSLQYAATCAPQPARVVAAPYDMVTTAVVDACAATGHAVDLAAIRAAAARRGVVRTSDQLSTMLEALVTTSDARAMEDQVQARLEVVAARGKHCARARRFWRPVGSAYMPDLARPLTRSAALRAAIAATVSLLGRPVSPREVKLWANAHPDHPAAPAVRRASKIAVRFASTLRGLLARRLPDDIAVHDYSSPRATDGGTPLRVGGVAVTPLERTTARYLDLCRELRPAQELRDCERLRSESIRLRTTALTTLAERRASHLARLVQEELARVYGDADIPWDALEERTASAGALLESWWLVSTRAKRARLPEWITDVHDAAASVAHVRACAAAREPGLPPTSAGEAGLRTLQEAATWLQEVLRPQGRAFGTVQPYLAAVRRFSNPRWEHARLYNGEREPFSLPDVGDLFDVAAEQTTHGDLAELLRGAVDVLGYATRDARVLRDVLSALPAYATAYRHGVAVALAALGEVVPPNAVILHADDRGGVDAYALAVAIAPLTPAARRDLLLAMGEALSPDLRRWAARMARRAEDGDTISMIM